MGQQRITCYFSPEGERKSTTSQPCYFLQLPFHIRRQIYCEAGLYQGQYIDLNLSASLKKTRSPDDLIDASSYDDEPIYDDSKVTRTQDLPLSLLLVCRTVHREAEKLIYDNNIFVITRRLCGGLQALERISETATRALRQLTIRVNSSSCVRSCCHKGISLPICGNSRQCHNRVSHDPPLGNTSRSDKQILSQWQRICTRLAAFVEPNRLSLYVICDCANKETAELVVEGLLALPTLKGCAIRLGKEPNIQLKPLTESAVLHLTAARSSSQDRFPFLDLSQELQLMVLSYTNLVTERDIMCTKSGFRQYRSCHNNGFAVAMEPGMEHDSRGSFAKCFCSQAHVAFNIRCTCEDYPSSHFLVSHEYRQVALQVFFGQNQFRVSWNVPCPQDENRDCALSLPILWWLPIVSLPFLKFLVLEIDSAVPKYSLLNPEGWQQWLQNLATLRQNANLPALTLDIRMEEPFWHSSLDIHSESLGARYAIDMRENYTKFCAPVAMLRGLKALFIWMNWNNDYGVVDGRQEQEHALETLVMGERYDSWKLGKGKRIQYCSPWEAMGH